MDIDQTALAKMRKQLYFRADHRGMRELDILVGGFAKHHLEQMNYLELVAFSELLHFPEPLFYKILINKVDPKQLLLDHFSQKNQHHEIYKKAFDILVQMIDWAHKPKVLIAHD